MLKVYLMTSDLLGRLRSDKAGVVSFEYVIVAASVVAVVAAAFGPGASGPIFDSLSGAITTVAGRVTSAVSG